MPRPACHDAHAADAFCASASSAAQELMLRKAAADIRYCPAAKAEELTVYVQPLAPIADAIA